MMKHISEYLYRSFWICSLNPSSFYDPIEMPEHLRYCKGKHWTEDACVGIKTES